MIPMRAEVVGRNKKWAWIRVFTDRWYILTLSDSVLPRGTKEARWVNLEIDPGSLHNDGLHYTADVIITGKADD